MKRLRTITGLLAVCGLAAFFTGCGGDNNDNNTTVVSNAPSSLNGQTYNLTGNTGPSAIAFATEGTGYTLTAADGSTETGTFTATRSGDSWDINATRGDASATSNLKLNFSGDGVGTYSFTEPGSPTPIQGTFTRAASSGGTTTGSTTGTTTGATTGATTGTTTGDTTGTTSGDTSGSTTGTTTGATTGDTTGTTTTTGATTGTTTGTTTGATTGSTSGTTTTTGDTTGTTTGTTTGATTGSTTGTTTGSSAPPATISSITVHTDPSSPAGSQDYTATFTGGTFNFTAGGGPGLSGPFEYTVTGPTTAHLVLHYSTPYAGDYDDMTLTFTGPGTGTISGSSLVQSASPNPGTITGTFVNAQ
jgi:hypothetical protein